MTDQINPDDILERARGIYFAGVIDYRDAMLKAGRILHEYVLARLEQSQGLDQAECIRRGLTREQIVKGAASRLETEVHTVNRMIGQAMTLELLGQGVELKGVLIDTVNRFRPFIRRLTGRKDENKWQKPESIRRDLETWKIKDGFEDSAKVLFLRAVNEGWLQEQVRNEVNVLYRGRSNIPRRGLSQPRKEAACREPKDTHERRVSAAKRASPGDVAEMCLELIEVAEDPKAVALKLQAMLPRFLIRRRESMLV